MKQKIIKFILLVLLTIGANYYAPDFFSSLFFLLLLIIYLKSEGEEAFWLAFFLVVSDGFFGFFGVYDATLQIIPGLPSIEIGNFYIILSVIKAKRQKLYNPPFFEGFLYAFFIYLLFLVVQGLVVGLSGPLNVYFRVVKWLVPFALFYSIPRLFTQEEQYKECFQYLFPIAILAMGAQIFTIINAQTPPQFFGAMEETRHKMLITLEVEEDKPYRGIYNESILVISYFGALLLLAMKGKSVKQYYLYIVVISVLSAFFLSATRGYTVGAALILLPFLIFITRLDLNKIIMTSVGIIILFFAVQSNPIVKLQIDNSFKRMQTLIALAEGDVTADGTLKRLDTRSPRVMKVWRKSPLTGWGFSDMFIKTADMHVSNQTILMHSGILGYLLMISFFFYFHAKLYFKSLTLPAEHPYRLALLVFPIFFLGWFFMHSSTQNFFNYSQKPSLMMVQVIFFNLGALIYRRVNGEEERGKQIQELNHLNPGRQKYYD